MTPTAATPTATPQYIVGARKKGSTRPSARIGITTAERVLYATPKVRETLGNRLDLPLGPAQLRIARRWAAKHGLELVVKVSDPYPHVTGDRDCNSNLLVALERTARILSVQEGRKVTINIRSGRRLLSEQQALYTQNMYAPGVPKPGRPLTAYPNPNAPHVLGIAADCAIDGRDIGDYPGAIAALDQAGGCLPVGTEDWHVQLGENFAGAWS